MGSIQSIDLKVFQQLHHAAMVRGVHYLWGVKPGLTDPLSKIDFSDCSGWSRWLVYQATGGAVKLPEGSYQQYQYLAPLLIEKEYRIVNQPMDDPRLFISFIRPTEGHDGHVWFTRGSVTWECYGGHGVGCREPSSRPLPQEVWKTFEWGHVWE